VKIMLNTRLHVVTLCGLVAGLAGCDAFTALTKLGDCNAGFLTATEILALNVSARDFLAQADPPVTIDVMTDAQAQAVATFLELNDAQCAQEIEALAEQADSDPDSVQGLDDLAAAFEGTDSSFDPQNVTAEDLQAIFDSIFGSQG
jgi:hypothetical protein